MFITLNYIGLSILITIIILLTPSVYLEESILEISENLTKKFNSFKLLETKEIKFWDDLYITLKKINISISYDSITLYESFISRISYNDLYINFIYDIKFRYLSDGLKGSLSNEITYTKYKQSAYINIPEFSIFQQFADRTSYEISDMFSSITALMDSDINDYIFFDEFVNEEKETFVIKSVLYDLFMEKFSNILLYYPRCILLEQFDTTNEILQKSIIKDYFIIGCDLFQEIKIRQITYDTIIKEIGIALNVTKVKYKYVYRTSVQEVENSTYFSFIRILYGRKIEFGEVTPDREESQCINQAVQSLIYKAFQKVFSN